MLAREVRVFPESMRGTRPMDEPSRTMTHATIASVGGPVRPAPSTTTSATVAEVSITAHGRSLTRTYNGGEKQVIVPDNVPIVRVEPADRSLLMPGAHLVAFASRLPDGSLLAERVTAGKNGFVPPPSVAPMRLLRFTLFGTAIAAAGGAAGFTFNDGTRLQCVARGEPVEEYNAPPDHPLVLRNHTGIAEPNGSGYRIAGNAAKLGTLPPDVHDFIFFHECAHATVPTGDEFVANCVGLKAMRAAGRAGLAVETRLAAFYGSKNIYWQKTLACANTNRNPPAPPAPR